MIAQHCHSAVDTSFAALGPAKVAFLGVVQGITELLPVSSSAHMRAIPALLGWPDPGAAFSAAMQLAALLAVVTYFGGEILSITTGSLSALKTRQWRNRDLIFAAGVIVATIPIAIVGASLANIINACGSPLRTPMVVGIACFVMALLMGAAEIIARHTRSGVAGMSMWTMSRASQMALITEGMAPTVPASPQPLAPSGFVLQGISS